MLAAAGLEKGKNVLSLSPPGGAMRRIGAVADEERSKPQFDRLCGDVSLVIAKTKV